jgi:hypothetical protein
MAIFKCVVYFLFPYTLRKLVSLGFLFSFLPFFSHVVTLCTFPFVVFLCCFSSLILLFLACMFVCLLSLWCCIYSMICCTMNCVCHLISTQTFRVVLVQSSKSTATPYDLDPDLLHDFPTFCICLFSCFEPLYFDTLSKAFWISSFSNRIRKNTWSAVVVALYRIWSARWQEELHFR